MSLPKPPLPNSRLPHDSSVDEPTLAEYRALGWDPVDIRVLESSMDTCKLILLGLRLGTVEYDRSQLEALAFEIRVNGGFTSRVLDGAGKSSGTREMAKDEIDFLASIPGSATFDLAEREKKAAKAAKKASKAAEKEIPDAQGPVSELEAAVAAAIRGAEVSS